MDAQQGKEALFQLGQVVATPGALEAIQSSSQTPREFLDKHSVGDWGTVDKEDAQANQQALCDGLRILSAYQTSNQTKIWIITEADRSATTILLPSEY